MLRTRTNTNTHAHTHARKRTHTRTHTYARTHTHANMYMNMTQCDAVVKIHTRELGLEWESLSVNESEKSSEQLSPSVYSGVQVNKNNTTNREDQTNTSDTTCNKMGGGGGGRVSLYACSIGQISPTCDSLKWSTSMPCT